MNAQPGALGDLPDAQPRLHFRGSLQPGVRWRLGPADYQDFPSFWGDPSERKWNLWGYVDERDVAAACRLALKAPAEAVAGRPSFIIAAADTVMNRPSAGLLAEVFPDVRLAREVGEFGTLLAIDRARKVLGFEPHHTWRNHIPTQAQQTR